MPRTRRTVLKGVAALLGASQGALAAERDSTDWAALGQSVKAEMAWSWANYVEHAFGQDQIRPVSGAGQSFFFHDHPMGLTIVEALDTLWVMGLDAQFEQGVNWTLANLRFDLDRPIQVFETSIRLVGGLLSAHHACDDKRLLALAHDLTERLLPAFTRSPTGMPYRFVNLKTGAVSDPNTYPAEVGSYLPEWGTLSRLVGDRRFYDAPKRAMQVLFEHRSRLGLIADGINAETGAWTTREATVGEPSDSYYEYLWDSWQLLGDADCKRWYDTLTAAILAHEQDHVRGQLWFPHVDFETGKVRDHLQSELDSFYGGLLAQGGARREGRALTLSWASIQDRFEIIPEEFDYVTLQVTHPSNALRPELADSCFNLWLLDRDPLWRHIAAKHFMNMKRHCKTRYGYSGVRDVTKRPMPLSDSCPAYWWSEQMKYYYLLFSDTPRFNYSDNYLSTEGDVLRGFRPA
jgi:mannosyl-oligosaccharide alpha-1,2-mannosidase